MNASLAIGKKGAPIISRINRNWVKNLRFASNSPSIRREYQRTKVHCNVGTIGHVDHGKTTLTSAITHFLASQKKAHYIPYAQIDKAPDERRRGITINASVVEYTTANRHYAHTDCPGHSDYIKNMIIGSASMDYGILVVAATDGVMPQTREHLLLARQAQVSNLVVFVNKCDLIDEEMRTLVEIEVQQLLAMYKFDVNQCPIIFGSALKSLEGGGDRGVEELLRTLDAFDEPKRLDEAPVMLSIDSIHSIKNKGTVVTGKLLQGSLQKGRDIVIQGYGVEVKTSVVSIETFQKSVDLAKAGDILGICLKNVKKDKLRRGMFLSSPDSMKFMNYFKAKIYALSREESGIDTPLVHESQLQLYHHSSRIPVFVYLPGGESSFVMPGDSGECEVLMQRKMAMRQGSRFTLRKGNHTLGYGIVTDSLADKDWYEVEVERKKRRKALEKAEQAKQDTLASDDTTE